MTTEPIKPRWFMPTPGKLVLALVITVLLLLFADPTNGWMVLTGVVAFILTILVGLVWCGIALLLRRRFQFSILSLLGLMSSASIDRDVSSNMQMSRPRRLIFWA